MVTFKSSLASADVGLLWVGQQTQSALSQTVISGTRKDLVRLMDLSFGGVDARRSHLSVN